MQDGNGKFIYFKNLLHDGIVSEGGGCVFGSDSPKSIFVSVRFATPDRWNIIKLTYDAAISWSVAIGVGSLVPASPEGQGIFAVDLAGAVYVSY